MNNRIKALEEALHRCVSMLDALVSESGRAIDWGYEDAFRMGEWFEADDLQAIEAARAALAASQTAPDCQQPDLVTAQAGQTVEIDIRAVFMEQIEKAAGESPWVPPEYCMNEVISDLCTFLRQPRAQAGQEPVVWRYRHSETENWHYGPSRQSWWECQPLYAAPPAITVQEAALRRIADMKPHHAGETVNEYHMRQTAITALADCRQPELVTALEDLILHREPWRNAIEKCKQLADADPQQDEPDAGDRSYWAHELQVFDRVFSEIVSPSRRAEFEAKGSALLQAEVAAMQAECGPDVMQVAAQHLAQLRAWKVRIKALEEALRPFAFSGAEYDDVPDDAVIYIQRAYNSSIFSEITMRDLRNAALAASQTAPDCQQATSVTEQAGEAVKWPARCDGIEQDAFEAWAKSNGYDMAEHPLHWLFLNARTSAARHGWAAGLAHAVDRMRFPTPGAKVQAEQEPVAWVMPGDDCENCDGFIDAMAYPCGEFTRPLYAAPPAITVQEAQCCACGKRGLSTAEDGGPECELADGRWTCSRDCYERAVVGATVQEAARVLLAANLMDLIDGAMSDAIDETDEGTWVDEDRGACVGSAALANAWVAALRSIGGDA